MFLGIPTQRFVHRTTATCESKDQCTLENVVSSKAAGVSECQPNNIKSCKTPMFGKSKTNEEVADRREDG